MRFSRPTDVAALRAWCAEPTISHSLAIVREAALPTAQADRHASFALIADDGAILAECLFPGRYLLHTNLLPSGRGASGSARLKLAVAKMFVHRPADFLFLAICKASATDIVTAERLGFTFAFDLACSTDSTVAASAIYQLALHDWVATGYCAGVAARLEAKLKRANGFDLVAGDRLGVAFLGVALAMFENGRSARAVETFNAWAVCAGRSPIRVLSEKPLRIHTGRCVVRLERDALKVEEVFNA